MSVIGSFGIIESEKIDLIVQGSLEIHALMVSDFSRTESIFEPIVPLIASMERISECAQYHLLMEALFKRIESICVKAITKYRRGTLTEPEKLSATRNIWFCSHELYFIEQYKKPVKVPERTVLLMLQALVSMKLDPMKMGCFSAKLAEFCGSEACQDIIYSSIIGGFQDPEYYLEMIKISPKIRDSLKYDVFLNALFSHYKDSNDSCQIARYIFAKNILNGPSSHTASEILLSLIDEDDGLLLAFADEEKYINLLCKLFINCERVDLFLSRLTSADPKINSIKEKVIKASKLHEGILILTQPSSFLDDLSDVAHCFDTYHNLRNVLYDYIPIDIEFVKQSSIKINEQISKLTKVYEETENMSLKLASCCTNFLMVLALPQLWIDDLHANYEPLFDQLLYLESVGLRPELNYEYFVKALALPFVKIESSSILEKLLAAIHYRNSDSDHISKLNTVVDLMLVIHSRNDSVYLSLLQMTFDFYNSKEIPSDNVFIGVLTKLVEKRDMFLARKTFEFCRERRIFSKTGILIIGTYIKHKLKADGDGRHH